jgi:hypothetical protein
VEKNWFKGCDLCGFKITLFAENHLVSIEFSQQLKGSVSQQHAIDLSVYECANYVRVLDSYSGVLYLK